MLESCLVCEMSKMLHQTLILGKDRGRASARLRGIMFTSLPYIEVSRMNMLQLKMRISGILYQLDRINRRC